MLRGKDVQETEALKRQGLSIRAIGRLTGYDRKTISKFKNCVRSGLFTMPATSFFWDHRRERHRPGRRRVAPVQNPPPH